MIKNALLKLLLSLTVVSFLSGSVWAQQGHPLELQDGLSTLSQQLMKKKTNIGNRKIAVTDLKPLYGEMGNLGAFIAEELTSLLARQGVRLLERRLIDESLKELRLNQSDLVDPMSAKRFGRFTGTELLLLGSMTEFEKTVKINARLVDIETVDVVSTGEVLIRKDKQIFGPMGIPYPGRLVINVVGGAMVYLDGTPSGQTNLWGNLKLDKVKPGSHSITVQKEGYRSARHSIFVEEDQELQVGLSMEKLPSPGTAVFLSMIFPGGGDIYLGHDDWWLYTLSIGGSIYGAVYYSKEERIDELVWIKNDTGSGQHLEKRGESPMYAFAALAAGIWIYDLVHVSSSAKALRYTQSHEVNTRGFMIVPESEGARVVYRWTW
ncbi:MAG: PEGA domain-containing protein [Nitrospirae bacterium]|nr:PEGA domain-containing protein [Nitrospirota bacterium]